MRKKVIGTGLSGLVGSRIKELLINEFDFIDFSLATGVDILDFNSLESAFQKYPQAETVLHLVAFTDTKAAWEQRGDKKGLCYSLNVNGTQNVVDLSHRYKKYLIYFSTDFVFSGEKEGVYTEEDKQDPIDWYGYTKYLGEIIVQKSKLAAAIVRIAFPFRAKFEPKKDLVRKIIDGFKNQKLWPMFTDQIITPTFIDDIALAMKYFITQKPKGIFHLVGSSFESPYKIALKIAEVFGFNDVIPASSPPQDQREYLRGENRNLIKKISLEEYHKNLPIGSRRWQKNLSLSNQKVIALGIKMKTFSESLLEFKKQWQD